MSFACPSSAASAASSSSNDSRSTFEPRRIVSL
jgi:hypothetical protein